MPCDAVFIRRITICFGGIICPDCRVLFHLCQKKLILQGLLQFIDLDSRKRFGQKQFLKHVEMREKDYLGKLVATGYSIENTAKEVCEIIESVE